MTQDAIRAGLHQTRIVQLQTAFARFLVTVATECWIKKVADPRILQEKLVLPGQNVWLFCEITSMNSCSFW